MDYRTNELSLHLPASPTDHTINILKFAKLASTLVIGRGPIEEGKTLEASFNTQLETLARTAPEFKQDTREAVRVGKAGDIEAIETRNQFAQGKERIYQYQLACLLPDSKTMLALTYGKTKPLDARDAEHWALIKQSFEFSGAPSAS
jgi:hypothetical protein